MEHQLFLAIELTVLAGLATTIGGALCLFVGKETSSKMGVALSITAGVMLYISIMELLPEGQSLLISSPLQHQMLSIVHLTLLAAITIFLIRSQHCGEQEKPPKYLKRSSILIIFSITLHNFPEGMATLTTTLVDTKLGILSAVAIAIHNIPEGLAIAIPIYKMTASYPKAVLAAFGSGIAEPIGALMGYYALNPFLNDWVLGAILCSIAGIMIYISLIQILPLAQTMARPRVIISSTVAGGLLMAASFSMFQV